MDLRLKGLSTIDPLAVPLPNGTEITTRIDRSLGEKRIAQGATGRVVGSSSDGIDVHLVGVGVVRYQREELVPRRSGQVRYAQRRASAWDQLRPCAVLESTVGSRAWGLAHEGSDTDLRGVFALPFSWGIGLGEPPSDLVSADGSHTYWEAAKAIKQALRSDPNTLEMLFVREIRVFDPIGQWIIDARDKFVSVEIYGSFGRYALSQLKRLAQSLRLAEHRGVVIDWLRAPVAPSLDDVAEKLSQIDPRHYPSHGDAVLQAKEYIKQLYRSLFDQGMLSSRDFDSLVSFARTDPKALELPRDVRPKNAYNLIRLLATAIHWLKTGEAKLALDGSIRDELLAIKQGNRTLDEVMALAESLTPELEVARQQSVLPAHPDVAAIDLLLRRVAEETAKRWVLQTPDVWGAQAPSAPEVEWDE